MRACCGPSVQLPNHNIIISTPVLFNRLSQHTQNDCKFCSFEERGFLSLSCFALFSSENELFGRCRTSFLLAQFNFLFAWPLSLSLYCFWSFRLLLALSLVYSQFRAANLRVQFTQHGNRTQACVCLSNGRTVLGDTAECICSQHDSTIHTHRHTRRPHARHQW